jgi:hypothetical protein
MRKWVLQYIAEEKKSMRTKAWDVWQATFMSWGRESFVVGPKQLGYSYPTLPTVGGKPKETSEN